MVLLRLLAFCLLGLGATEGYEKYISEYAGDYLKQFGGHSKRYGDYIGTYTGVGKDAEPVTLVAQDSDKKDEKDKKEKDTTADEKQARRKRRLISIDQTKTSTEKR